VGGQSRVGKWLLREHNKDIKPNMVEWPWEAGGFYEKQ